ncbi:MAG: large ribosomal subunit protein uL3, partial [Salinispira sp.]
GTQGVMKRWGFRGGRATHGSKFHREHGATGMAAWPSKVIKGTKMAGRMGNERVTVQNIRVIRVDPEKQLMLVKGAVPGRKNGLVLLRNAQKKS